MHVTLHKIVVLVITKYTSENSMLDYNNNIHTKNDNIIIKILFSVHKKKYCTQKNDGGGSSSSATTTRIISHQCYMNLSSSIELIAKA